MSANLPLIDRLVAGLSEWQIYFLIMGLLLQGIIVAFAPEEVIMMSAGVLWSQGRVRWPLALLAIAVGLLSANLIIVFVTGKLGHLKFFQKPAIHQALEKFRKRGRSIIFLTRFTPFIRGPVYYAAGISGMTVWNFFKVDALAFCIHTPIVFLIGALIGLHTGSITEAYKIIAIVAVSVAATVAVSAFVRERFLKRAELAETVNQ